MCNFDYFQLIATLALLSLVVNIKYLPRLKRNLFESERCVTSLAMVIQYMHRLHLHHARNNFYHFRKFIIKLLSSTYHRRGSPRCRGLCCSALSPSRTVSRKCL